VSTYRQYSSCMSWTQILHNFIQKRSSWLFIKHSLKMQWWAFCLCPSVWCVSGQTFYALWFSLSPNLIRKTRRKPYHFSGQRGELSLSDSQNMRLKFTQFNSVGLRPDPAQGCTHRFLCRPPGRLKKGSLSHLISLTLLVSQSLSSFNLWAVPLF